jgi:hypothetical protein
LKRQAKTHRKKFELVAHGKHPEQFQHTHILLQVLVIDHHRVVPDVVVGSNAAKLGGYEPAFATPFVLDELALLEEDGGTVDDVGAFLEEGGVGRVLIVDGDTV